MSLLAASGYQSIYEFIHKLEPRRTSSSLRPHSIIVSARNQPRVTRILIAGPLLPGKLDICSIPVEKMRELTIDLTGKFDIKFLEN